MNWTEVLPQGAKIYRQQTYYYGDPQFPHHLQILVTETLVGNAKFSFSSQPGPGQTVQAVLVGDYAQFKMSFSPKVPHGWGITVEEALLNFIKTAKENLVLNDQAQ